MHKVKTTAASDPPPHYIALHDPTPYYSSSHRIGHLHFQPEGQSSRLFIQSYLRRDAQPLCISTSTYVFPHLFVPSFLPSSPPSTFTHLPHLNIGSDYHNRFLALAI
ncbi:hypothetical protein VTL71DRAFT_5048 [Oculimacula yallundae]|uniref:Uncharacterized protein n=1 Tax=Oculimacula yallundae TaxID=86028 RepID=A0ABR4C011_9HELO